VGGKSYRAYRVNIASGLSNTTAYFEAEAPHVLLERVGEQGREDMTSLQSADAGPGRDGGSG